METKTIAAQSDDDILREIKELCAAALAVTDDEKLIKYHFEEHLQLKERAKSVDDTPWISHECKCVCGRLVCDTSNELFRRQHALLEKRAEYREDIIQEAKKLYKDCLGAVDADQIEEALRKLKEFKIPQSVSMYCLDGVSSACQAECRNIIKRAENELCRRKASIRRETEMDDEREKLTKAKRTDIERFADICRDAMTGWYEFRREITPNEKKMYDELKKIHQVEDIPPETIKEYEKLCEDAKKEIEEKRLAVVRQHAQENLRYRNKATKELFEHCANDVRCGFYESCLQYVTEENIHDISSTKLVHLIGAIALYARYRFNDPSITEEFIVPTDVCKALRIVRSTLLSYAVVGIDDLDYRNVVHTLLQKSYEITKPGSWMRDFYYKMFPDELIVTEDSDEE